MAEMTPVTIDQPNTFTSNSLCKSGFDVVLISEVQQHFFYCQTNVFQFAARMIASKFLLDQSHMCDTQ